MSLSRIKPLVHCLCRTPGRISLKGVNVIQCTGWKSSWRFAGSRQICTSSVVNDKQMDNVSEETAVDRDDLKENSELVDLDDRAGHLHEGQTVHDTDNRNDYKYFSSVIASVLAPQNNTTASSRSISAIPKTTGQDVDEEAKDDEEGKDKEANDSAVLSIDRNQLSAFKPGLPGLPVSSDTLSPYVNESETLTKLVQLGVDLSRILEKRPEVANYLVKKDFPDIEPHLLFLHKVGVPDEELGECISRAPMIFLQSLDDMQIRINYLESKQFSVEQIARIVTRAGVVLCQPVQELDGHLGFLQKLFNLTGDEVRLTVARLPKITVYDKRFIKEIHLTVQEFMGFTDSELKQMLLAHPKLYLTGKRGLLERFDYVHNTIGLTHKQIVAWPGVLCTRLHVIRQRHQFLKAIGRDQFDPTKQNYVSSKALVTGRDHEFCFNIAKVPVEQFNDFLKTL